MQNIYYIYYIEYKEKGIFSSGSRLSGLPRKKGEERTMRIKIKVMKGKIMARNGNEGNRKQNEEIARNK